MLVRYALGFLSAAAIALVVFTVQPGSRSFRDFALVGNLSVSTNISTALSTPPSSPPSSGSSSSSTSPCWGYGDSCVSNPGGCCAASSLACKIAGSQMLCLPATCSMDYVTCMFDFECCSGACNANQCGSSSSSESSDFSLPSEYCGDGITQASLGEQCDDGNGSDDDSCTITCQNTYCGDYIVQNDDNPFDDEDCDDGPQDTSLCDYDGGDRADQGCSEAKCGDGYKNLAAGEQCDDSNVTDGDGCDDNCQIEYACGDGNVGGPEQCDDHNTNSGDGCDSSCNYEACTGCSLAGADAAKCAEIPQCIFDDGNTLLKFFTFGFAGNPSCKQATSCQTDPVGVCCPDPEDPDPTHVCGAPVPKSQCETTDPFFTATWKESPQNTCASCTPKSSSSSSSSESSSSSASTGTCCYMKRNSTTGNYEQITEAVPSEVLHAPSWCGSIYKGVFNPDPVPDPLKCPDKIDLKVTKTGPGETLVEPLDELDYVITVTLESGELPSDAVAKVLDSVPFGLEPVGLPTTEQSGKCSWPGGTGISFVTCLAPGGVATFNLKFKVKGDGCPNTGMLPNSAIVYAPAGYYDDNVSNDIGFASSTTLKCPTGQGVCCEYTYGQATAQCKYPVTGSQCTGINKEFKAGETDCDKANVCPPKPVGTCCNAANYPTSISCTKQKTKAQCTGSTEEWVEDTKNDHAGKTCNEICDESYSVTTCCFADPTQCKMNITQSSCEALGGNPQGLGVNDCSQCKPVGACCTVSPTYSCSENKQASECTSGTFINGKSCTWCQYEVGVCCGAKGQSKENVSKDACTALSDFAPAQWYANKDAAYCPQTGACCDPTSATGCSEITQDACYKIPNGSFQGVGKKCSDPGLSCTKMGACCEAGKTCKQSTQSQCPSPAHWSEGKTCEEACPTGMCCYLDGDTPKNTCGVNSLACDKLSGSFNAGPSCTAATCKRYYCYQGAYEATKSCHALEWAPGMNPPVEGAIAYNDKTSCDLGQCNPSAPKGACCATSGTCTDDVTSDACSGDWKEGKACDEANLCGSTAKAACCSASGKCSLTTAAACTGTSKFHPDVPQCSPVVCGQVVCCAPPNVPGVTKMCQVVNTTQCKNMGGTVKTGLSTISCDGNPCDLGACCSPDGNQCVLSTSSSCSTASGKSYHAGTTCNMVDCTKPAQQCCQVDASGNAVQCANAVDASKCLTSLKPEGQNCGGECAQQLYCCTDETTPLCKSVTDAGGPSKCKAGTFTTGSACAFKCPAPEDKKYCCNAATKGCDETTAATCPGGGTPMDESSCKNQPACKEEPKKYCCDAATGKCGVATGATCTGGQTPSEDETACNLACAVAKKYCCTPSDSSMDAPSKCVEKTTSTVCAGGTYVNDSCGGACSTTPKRNWCCTNVNTNTCAAKTEGVDCSQKSAAGYYTQGFCISQCEPDPPTCAAAGESCTASKPCCNTADYQCVGGTCKAKTVACCASNYACFVRIGTTCPSGEKPIAGNPAACPAASTKPCGEPPVTEKTFACCDGPLCTEKTKADCEKAGYKSRSETSCTANLCNQPEKPITCCTNAGRSCKEVTASTCSSLGGVPSKSGAAKCAIDTCPAAVEGACCLRDSTTNTFKCSPTMTKEVCGSSVGGQWLNQCNENTCKDTPVSMCDESKGCYAMNQDGTCPVDPDEFAAAPRSWWARLTGWLTGSSTKAMLVPSTGGCCCRSTGGSSSNGGSSSPPVASSSVPPVPTSSSKPSTPLTCDKCSDVKVLSSCTSPCSWNGGFSLLSIQLWGGSCQKGPQCPGGNIGGDSGANGGDGQSSRPPVSSPRPSSSVPASSSKPPVSSTPGSSSVPVASSSVPTSSHPSSVSSSTSTSSMSSRSKRKVVSIGFSYVVACPHGFIRNVAGVCTELITCPAGASRPEIINYCTKTECTDSSNRAACEAGCVCGCSADLGTDTTKREAASTCVRDCQAHGNEICGPVPTANCCRGSCIDKKCGSGSGN